MPDWRALAVSPDEDFAGAPLLRHEFRLDEGHGAVTRATLHATAQGVFEAYLNGRPVSDDVLAPGWSSYEWRLRYRSYDVTSLLQPASPTSSSVSRWATDGSAGGSAGAAGGPTTANELSFLGQLEIEFADGHVQTVVTDESWTAGPSAVTENDLYDGQTIDARRRIHRLAGARVLRRRLGRRARADLDLNTLTPYIGPPIRRSRGAGAGQRSGPRPPARRWSTSARISWAGCASRSRGRPAPRSPCGTPRCSSTTNSACGRCALPRRRIGSS